MTFEEIFNQDGLYYADGFAEGFCFEINDGKLLSVNYKSRYDMFPRKENFPCYKGLFKKDYRKVFTVKQLFSTPTPH